jgi:hypothetical protein
VSNVNTDAHIGFGLWLDEDFNEEFTGEDW